MGEFLASILFTKAREISGFERNFSPEFLSEEDEEVAWSTSWKCKT